MEERRYNEEHDDEQLDETQGEDFPKRQPFLPPEARIFLMAVVLGGVAAVVLAGAVASVLIASGRYRAVASWTLEYGSEPLLLSLALTYTIQFLPHTLLAAALCAAAVAVGKRISKARRDLAVQLQHIAMALAAAPTPAPAANTEADPKLSPDPLKMLNLELDREPTVPPRDS